MEERREKKGRGGGGGASLRTEEEVPRASSDSDIKAPFQQRKSHVYACSVSSHTCNIFTFSFTLTCAVIGRGRSNRSSLHAALGVQSFFHSPSFSQQIVFFPPVWSFRTAPIWTAGRKCRGKYWGEHKKKKTPHVTFTVEGQYCIFPGFCKSKQLREGLFFK